MRKAVVLSQNVESPENDFYFDKNTPNEFLRNK